MIETQRLILRDWRDEDWPRFWEGTNTPEVMRWLGGVADEATRVAARGRIERYRAEHGHTFWCVERKDDAVVLGFCGLKRSNQQGGPQGLMEIGWRLREDAWGHGYAREAATASLDHAFAHHDDGEVIALTVERNVASCGLMKRLGMRRREDLDFPSAEFDAEQPVIIAYSIDRTSWKASRA